MNILLFIVYTLFVCLCQCNEFKRLPLLQHDYHKISLNAKPCSIAKRQRELFVDQVKDSQPIENVGEEKRGCKRVAYHGLTNHGFGSDLHGWASALCWAHINHFNLVTIPRRAIQCNDEKDLECFINKTTLSHEEFKWIWSDEEYCNSENHLKNPFSCYWDMKHTCIDASLSQKIIGPRARTRYRGNYIIYGHNIDHSPPPPPQRHHPHFHDQVEDRRIGRFLQIERPLEHISVSPLNGCGLGYDSEIQYLFHHLNQRVIHLARKEILNIFGSKGTPSNMISVHIRWGDKAVENALVPMSKYVKSVNNLINKNNIGIHDDRSIQSNLTQTIFISTEDMAAYHEFVKIAKIHFPNWTVKTYLPAIAQDSSVESPQSPITTARETHGNMAIKSLVSLLILLQSKYLVLTPASNWSRIIDELHEWLWDEYKVINELSHVQTDRIYLWGDEAIPGAWTAYNKQRSNRDSLLRTNLVEEEGHNHKDEVC